MSMNAPVNFGKVIEDILPISLLMNGCVMAFSYAVVLTGTTPWSGFSEIQIASMAAALLSVLFVSCSFKVSEVPLYLIQYLFCIMEPVWYMFVYLVMLSAIGIVQLQTDLIQSIGVLVVVLVLNSVFFGVPMLFIAWAIGVTKQF